MIKLLKTLENYRILVEDLPKMSEVEYDKKGNRLPQKQIGTQPMLIVEKKQFDALGNPCWHRHSSDRMTREWSAYGSSQDFAFDILKEMLLPECTCCVCVK